MFKLILLAWFSAGALTNPAIDTIMADSGAAAVPGQTSVTVICASTVAAILALEHRNATNTANIASQIVTVAANGTAHVSVAGISYATSERFRVRLTAAITGQAQCSIISF
jgi:hypothetical protein